jgi:hypothetical protein
MAPGVGIEPTIAESKSVVLPLHYPGIKLGAANWTRTSNTRIFSPLLYHWSYCGKNMVPHDRIELPYSDYKTDVIPLYE